MRAGLLTKDVLLVASNATILDRWFNSIQTCERAGKGCHGLTGSHLTSIRLLRMAFHRQSFKLTPQARTMMLFKNHYHYNWPLFK
jgi:hypothetical protein